MFVKSSQRQNRIVVLLTKIMIKFTVTSYSHPAISKLAVEMPLQCWIGTISYEDNVREFRFS
jgi:hypothetical protein